MQMALRPDQKTALLEFREFAETEVAPRAAAHDAEERVDRKLVDVLAGRGYLCPWLPRVFGGRGLDLPTWVLLHEELGRACSSLRSLLTAHDMAARVVWRFGTAEQRGRWLPSLVSGAAVAAFAVSEPGAGSDTAAIVTRAERDGDGWRLDGEKAWISFGQLADVFVLFARTGGGVSTFLVERASPGVGVEPISGMLGLRGAMLAHLRLDGCRVPSTHVVGDLGRGNPYIESYGLTLGRLSVAAGCVGIVQGCLEASVRYARSRSQFGVRLQDHQLIRAKLAHMAVDVDAARLLCLQAAFLIQEEDPRAPIEAAMAKFFAAAAAVRAAREAVQIHGANGCSRDYPVERYYRDAKIMEIIEGSTEIQLLMIGVQGYCELPSLVR